jgi:DNA-binding LacI/PurR family transcriptional regulator
MGIAELRELLQANPRPDAIVCTNDFVAKNCLQELRKQGLRVPQDIAVAGFDDLDFSQYLTPSLTTVRQPLNQIGQFATDLLISKINKSLDCEKQLFLDCELVIRESA